MLWFIYRIITLSVPPFFPIEDLLDRLTHRLWVGLSDRPMGSLWIGLSDRPTHRLWVGLSDKPMGSLWIGLYDRPIQGSQGFNMLSNLG